MNRFGAIVPVLLIVLAPAAMLYPLWSNPVSAGEDDIIYYWPMRKMVAESLAAGRWPLDNPYEATGLPLMGDPDACPMYPPAWLFMVLDTRLAYSLTLFLAFSLAGGGAYLYLRRLGLRRGAACFGSVAFMFCGFLVGHRVHWTILHGAAYLPWGLWCIEGLRRRPAAAFLWMVPVAYLAITTGHPPTIIHMGMVWTAYLLMRGRPLWRAALPGAAAMILAAAMAASQLDVTYRALSAATRTRIGYATAGENSFYPASAVLALFPFFLGSRTPNFFPQSWWGPWHLCETLGYVGLPTLVLAGSAIWKLYLKPRRRRAAPEPPPPASAEPDAEALRGVVHAWTWIALGAGIWVLGYYLPTYKLIHALPMLGVMRCPARLLVAVDMALATLAAIAVHVMAGGAGGAPARLARTICRAATFLLPGAMVLALAAFGVAAWLSILWFGGQFAFFQGDAARQALRAILPSNPAVWVPLLLAAATIAVIRWWLKAPGPRQAALVPLLLVDLFFITRFVDVPGAGKVPPDPEVSPAGQWLRQHAGPQGLYRVWGIGGSYNDRPAELLLPRTANSLGFHTINSYGPFQAPAHAHLLGFRIYGTNPGWQGLVRRNWLLSAYGVRYILTARKEVREVLESIRVPDRPPPPDGPNLLGSQWWLDRARVEDGVISLRTPMLWSWAIAKQPLQVKGGMIYRIALDARGPDGGAANFLRAEVFSHGWTISWEQRETLGLTAYEEQLGPDWRHFEWTFLMPQELAGDVLFRVFTMSERTIQVRDISLRESHWDVPLRIAGRPAPGQPIYRLAAEVPAVDPADSPVAIYENLCIQGLPAGIQDAARAPQVPPEALERLKYGLGEEALRPEGPDWAKIGLPNLRGFPRIGLVVKADPRRTLWLATIPAVGLYVLLTIGVIALAKARGNGLPQRH